MERWRQQAKRLKTAIHAIALAYRDPRVPWYARAIAACVVAYAFSPIDLIPDPIPVLGYLDDLVLLPLGVVVALKLIPAPVMAECRQRTREAAREGRPTNWLAAAMIVLVWLALSALGVWLLVRALGR